MQVHAPCPRALAPPSSRNVLENIEAAGPAHCAGDRIQMLQPLGQDFRHADARQQSGAAPKGGIS